MKPVKLLLQIAAAAAVCLGLVAIQPASAEQTVTEEKYEETPLDTALKGAELAARWDALRR